MEHEHNRKLCSICGINPALIFIKDLKSDHSSEEGLCAPCAMKYIQENGNTSKPALDQKLSDALDEMRGLLSSIVNSIQSISTIVGGKSEGIACPGCGITYEQFRESGYLGCPDCYRSFKNRLHEIFLEIERAPRHHGKIPARYKKLSGMRQEAARLKRLLSTLIRNEEYEEAKRVHRRLDKLSGPNAEGWDHELD